MNRKAQVKICENCTHCKHDIERGIVCGLTDEYATFDTECPEFDASEAYIAKSRAKKDEADKPDSIGKLPAIILTYLFCLASQLVGDDNPNVTRVLLAVGVVIIGISLCLFFHARGRKIWRDRSRLNRNKIKEILRVEGYCPQDGENGTIIIKIQGGNYAVCYGQSVFQLIFGFYYDENIHTARVAAFKVMDEVALAKISVEQTPKLEQGLWTTVSVEVLTDSAEELQKRISDYVDIVQTAANRFAEVLCNIQKLRSQSSEESMVAVFAHNYYSLEYYWIPQMAEAVCKGELAVDALSDETWLLQQSFLTFHSKSGFYSKEALEWGIRIERIDNYGDYKLIVYGFPEPQSIPEAKYGAILLNTQTKVFDYYTLEFSYNGKWVLGRMQGSQHTNYGELESQPDVDAFVDWIFSPGKIPQSTTDCEKGDTENTIDLS